MLDKIKTTLHIGDKPQEGRGARAEPGTDRRAVGLLSRDRRLRADRAASSSFCRSPTTRTASTISPPAAPPNSRWPAMRCATPICWRCCNGAVKSQPEDVDPVLNDVIETAETVDTVHMRKESLAAIEELKEKGPELEARALRLGPGRPGRAVDGLRRRRRHRADRTGHSLRASAAPLIRPACNMRRIRQCSLELKDAPARLIAIS